MNDDLVAPSVVDPNESERYEPYEPEDEDPRQRQAAQSANATLDFFLGATPDKKVYAERELTRIGILFHFEAIEEEVWKRNLKRSEDRQTKQEKQRGVPVNRDNSKLEKLMIVDSCRWIARRIMTDEEAKAQNIRRTVVIDGEEKEVFWPYGPELDIRDPELLSKWGPRPEDFITHWTLPGERTALADMVTDLSGYGTNVLADPVDAAKN